MSTSSNLFDESPIEEEEVPLDDDDDEEFSTNSTRVLLVDADVNSLLRMQNLMTKFSYQVITYFNGEDAVGFLKKRKHEIDLVIWDFHMPQINGLDALNLITEEINLPVAKTVMKSITCGACDFLLKPLSQEVIEVLWRHVYRERIIFNSGLVKPEEPDTHEPQMDESDHNDQLSYDEGSRNKSSSKKLRLSWTPELHRDFEVAYKVQYRRSKAIPMEILKYMKEVLHVTQRLTRSNVASHLQKYRQNLSKKTRTDSDLEETPKDVGSRNDGPTAGTTFWANAGVIFEPRARPTAGPTFGPSTGPGTRPTSGPSVGQSYVQGGSNMFVNSNVNLYGGGRYVVNDRAVLNTPVQYASTTYQPMYNDPVITNTLLEQLQQYNLQLPNTVQAQQEPQRGSSSVLENPVQLIDNSTLPDDFIENLRVMNSHLDQTPRNGWFIQSQI